MADVPSALFEENNISMEIGNIYSVEHDGEKVIKVIRIEKDETKRRKEWLKSLGKKIWFGNVKLILQKRILFFRIFFCANEDAALLN